MNDQITIEIVYGLPDKQFIEVLKVAKDCTVKQALTMASELKQLFPDMIVDQQQIGVFAKHVGLDHLLTAGDRIEIYRPLIVDAKEARRKRAEKQKNREGKG